MRQSLFPEAYSSHWRVNKSGEPAPAGSTQMTDRPLVYSVLLQKHARLYWTFKVIIFRVSRRRRGEMYCGHARLCVCVCLSAAACPHYCTDPDVTWGSGRGCPLVVHCWADLQSVHGLRCYGNITRTRNVSEYMLALALCLVRLLQAFSNTIFRSTVRLMRRCQLRVRRAVPLQ